MKKLKQEANKIHSHFLFNHLHFNCFPRFKGALNQVTLIKHLYEQDRSCWDFHCWESLLEYFRKFSQFQKTSISLAIDTLRERKNYPVTPWIFSYLQLKFYHDWSHLFFYDFYCSIGIWFQCFWQIQHYQAFLTMEQKNNFWC